MKSKVKNLLDKLNIDPEEKLILSVSTGVDSMVLLDILLKLNYKVIVVHFNHQKREQSLKEAKFIELYCTLKGLVYYYFILNIEGKNFQSEASNKRKELLVATAIKEKANYILTAHHLDDLVETIAFRLIRGSSIAGISGFKEDTKISNVDFIKPLMEVSKQEIIEYAKTNFIEYYEDASNSTDDYSRNIIRNKLVPHFETINPQYRKSFLLFHEQQNELMEFLNYEAIKIIKNNIVHIKDYLKLPILLRTEVLVNYLEKNKIKYTHKKIEMLDKELFNKPNIKQVLESNSKVTKYLVKEYDRFGIEIEKNIEKIPFKDISVPLNKWVKIPFYYDTRKKRLIRRIFVTETDQISDNVRALLGKICYNDKCLPLLLRKRKDGDLLEFAYGHKKLSRFIIDNKITAAERKEILILASLKDDIIWIPNLYLNSEIKGESFLYIYGDDKQVGE